MIYYTKPRTRKTSESTCKRSLSTSIARSDPNFPERISNASPYLACCSNTEIQTIRAAKDSKRSINKSNVNNYRNSALVPILEKEK